MVCLPPFFVFSGAVCAPYLRTMITYADIASSYLLASELDVVVFAAASTLSLSIKDASNATVLSCSYTPVDGVVKVYDLDRLLSPLIAGVMADFTFTVGGSSTTFHIIQSWTRVSMPAADFIAGHFLSSVMSTRDTAMDRKEMVTLLATGSTDVSAVCTYVDGDDVIHTATVSLETGLAAGLHEVDCSPALLVNDELGALVAYTVQAGDRSMTYRVSPTQTHRLALLMRNNFGAWEPCYFRGMNEHSPKITRELVLVGGMMRPLKIDEEDTCKSYTGPLRPGGVQLLRDLSRSREVMLLEDGVATDPVVISGEDVKYTDEDGHLPEFTFSWHRASLRTMLHVPVIPRLFDDTFDETFN